MKLMKRLKARIKISTTGCWVWQGSKNTDGYGHMSVNGSLIGTHRISWELLVGPLTPGLTIDHLCRNRACCNPDHLEEVTLKENMLRGKRARDKLATQYEDSIMNFWAKQEPS